MLQAGLAHVAIIVTPGNTVVVAAGPWSSDSSRRRTRARRSAEVFTLTDEQRPGANRVEADLSASSITGGSG
jgi:hypothetical protein